MALSIDWATFTILVPRADLILVQSTPTEIRELNLNTFRAELKAIEASPEGMGFPKILDHYTAVNVGGIELAHVMVLLAPYTVTFEDGQYAVNLTRANSNVGDRVNVNQVSVRSANSAGLVQTQEIQLNAFGEAVTINTAVGEGFAGTLYPTGTYYRPVNNLADALLIAGYYGINKFRVIGTLTLNPGDNISGFTIEGEGVSFNVARTTITMVQGCITSNVLLKNCKVEGYQGGECEFHFCLIGNIENTHCQFHDCKMVGPVKLNNSNWTQNHFTDLKDCYTGVDWYQVDYNNSPINQIYMNFSGGIRISNMTDSRADLLIQLDAGIVWLDSTCTGGNVTIRGIGTVINESTSSVDITDLLTRETIADAVWDQTQSLKFAIESMRQSHQGFGKSIFWDWVNGDDANTGLTSNDPVRTWAAAEGLAASGAGDVIYVLSPASTQTVITDRFTVTKNNLSLRGPGRDVLFKPTAKNGGDTITVNADGFSLVGVIVETASTGLSDTDNNDRCVVVNGKFSYINECWINRGKQGVVYNGGDYHYLGNSDLEYHWDAGVNLDDLVLAGKGSPRELTCQNCIIYFNGTGVKMRALADPANSTRLNRFQKCNIHDNTIGMDIGDNVRRSVISEDTMIHTNTTDLVDNGYLTYDARVSGSGGGGDASWGTPLPGSYPQGSAGYILGTFGPAFSNLVSQHGAGTVLVPNPIPQGDPLNLYRRASYEGIQFTLGPEWSPYLDGNYDVYFSAKQYVTDPDSKMLWDVACSIVDQSSGTVSANLTRAQTDHGVREGWWQIRISEKVVAPAKPQVVKPAMEGDLRINPMVKKD